MRKVYLCIAAAVVAIAAQKSAYAVVVWSNTIVGTNPSASNPFTTGDVAIPAISVSGIGRGAGANANAGADRYNASSWDTAAFDSTAYFSWTITPNSGWTLDFDTLTGNYQASGTGPQSYSLRSSLDGFATDFESGAITRGSVQAFSFNLTAAQFNSITSPITFRLYAWDARNASGALAPTGTFSVNDFAFNAVAVPEASSFLFGGLALCAAGAPALSRRWKARKA